MSVTPDVPSVPDAVGRVRPRPAPPIAGPWTGRRVCAQHVELGRQDGVPVHVAGLVRHPVLERVIESRRGATVLAVAQGLIQASVLVVVGVLHLLLAEADSASAAVVLGVLTVVVAVLGVRAHRRLRRRVVEAGARVVAVLDGVGHGSWVETDRLECVDVAPSRSGPVLHLTDLDGRRVALPCGLAEANPALWALVHAGVEASAADGAHLRARARRRLGLPPSPRDPRPRVGQE